MTIINEYSEINREKAIKSRLYRRRRRCLDYQGCGCADPGCAQRAINAENAGKISKRVKIVAEGANGPTTPEADEYFKQQAIFDIRISCAMPVA